jgi:hypothetical protein
MPDARPGKTPGWPLYASNVHPSTGGTCTQASAGVVDCWWWAADTGPGSTHTVTFNLPTLSPSVQDYRAVVQQTPFDQDTNPANDDASAEATVRKRHVDYVTTLSVSPALAWSNAFVTLTATLSNTGQDAPEYGTTLTIGPDTSKNPGPGLVATDVLASGGGTCARGAVAGTIECWFPASIAGPGSSHTVAVRAQMPNVFQHPYVDYAASASPAVFEDDATPANDRASTRVSLASDGAVVYSALPGATVTTDDEGDGATALDPIETSVLTPTGGYVAITEPFPGAPSIAGAWSVLGYSVLITAPNATVANPLVLTFRFDSSLFTKAAALLLVLRNGVPAGTCFSPTAASPDPCVASVTTVGDDTVVTVRTSHASEWTFSVPFTDAGKVTGPGFTVQSDGDHVKGELQWGAFHAGDVVSLRLDGNRAWFAGFGRDGRPFEAYVEDDGRKDVFRLTIGGEQVADGAPKGNVQIHK